MRKRNGNGIRITDNGCTKAIHTQDTTNTSELTMNTDIVGAWVGVVEKCGARTAATRVSVSGNLGDLFDIVSNFFFGSFELWSSGYGGCLSFCTSVVRVRVVSFSSALYTSMLWTLEE